MVRLTLTLTTLLSMGLLQAEAVKRPKAKEEAPQKEAVKKQKTKEEAPAPKHVDSKHIKHESTKAGLDALVKGKKPVVAEFFFAECGACGMQDPLFSKIADALHDKVQFVKIDTTKGEGEKLVADYHIQAVPTIVIFNGGKRVHSIRGGHPANALTYLQNLITNGLKKTEEEKLEEEETVEKKKDEPKKKADAKK